MRGLSSRGVQKQRRFGGVGVRFRRLDSFNSFGIIASVLAVFAIPSMGLLIVLGPPPYPGKQERGEPVIRGAGACDDGRKPDQKRRLVSVATIELWQSIPDQRAPRLERLLSGHPAVGQL